MKKWLLCATVLALTQSPASARTLDFSFPDEPQYGFFEKPIHAKFNSGLDRLEHHNRIVHGARGKFKLEVADSDYLIYVPGRAVLGDPKNVRKISPRNIRCIKFNYNATGIGDDDVADKVAQSFVHFRELEFLDFNGCEIGDSTVKVLSALPDLKAFKLRSTEVTKNCLPDLCRMRTLKSLDLSECNMRAASLAPLAALPELETLSLYNSALEDYQIEALTKFPKLKDLIIGGNGRLTGRIIGILNGMKNLRCVILSRCNVKADSLAALRKDISVTVSAADFNAKDKERLTKILPRLQFSGSSLKAPDKDEMMIFAPTRY